MTVVKSVREMRIEQSCKISLGLGIRSSFSVRYGGVFTVGMAYRGTANNAAIQRLLHFAVSDVSDDVRRAAVLNLGFLLMGVPDQCPKIVSLLSESYNPHVRYGKVLVQTLRIPDCESAFPSDLNNSRSREGS